MLLLFFAVLLLFLLIFRLFAFLFVFLVLLFLFFNILETLFYFLHRLRLLDPHLRLFWIIPCCILNLGLVLWATKQHLDGFIIVELYRAFSLLFMFHLLFSFIAFTLLSFTLLVLLLFLQSLYFPFLDLLILGGELTLKLRIDVLTELFNEYAFKLHVNMP